MTSSCVLLHCAPCIEKWTEYCRYGHGGIAMETAIFGLFHMQTLKHGAELSGTANDG